MTVIITSVIACQFVSSIQVVDEVCSCLCLKGSLDIMIQYFFFFLSVSRCVCACVCTSKMACVILSGTRVENLRRMCYWLFLCGLCVCVCVCVCVCAIYIY